MLSCLTLASGCCWQGFISFIGIFADVFRSKIRHYKKQAELTNSEVRQKTTLACDDRYAWRWEPGPGVKRQIYRSTSHCSTKEKHLCLSVRCSLWQHLVVLPGGDDLCHALPFVSSKFFSVPLDSSAPVTPRPYFAMWPGERPCPSPGHIAGMRESVAVHKAVRQR